MARWTTISGPLRLFLDELVSLSVDSINYKAVFSFTTLNSLLLCGWLTILIWRLDQQSQWSLASSSTTGLPYSQTPSAANHSYCQQILSPTLTKLVCRYHPIRADAVLFQSKSKTHIKENCVKQKCDSYVTWTTEKQRGKHYLPSDCNPTPSILGFSLDRPQREERLQLDRVLGTEKVTSNIRVFVWKISAQT